MFSFTALLRLWVDWPCTTKQLGAYILPQVPRFVKCNRKNINAKFSHNPLPLQVSPDAEIWTDSSSSQNNILDCVSGRKIRSSNWPFIGWTASPAFILSIYILICICFWNWKLTLECYSDIETSRALWGGCGLKQDPHKANVDSHTRFKTYPQTWFCCCLDV